MSRYQKSIETWTLKNLKMSFRTEMLYMFIAYLYFRQTVSSVVEIWQVIEKF